MTRNSVHTADAHSWMFCYTFVFMAHAVALKDAPVLTKEPTLTTALLSVSNQRRTTAFRPGLGHSSHVGGLKSCISNNDLHLMRGWEGIHSQTCIVCSNRVFDVAELTEWLL